MGLKDLLRFSPDRENTTDIPRNIEGLLFKAEGAALLVALGMEPLATHTLNLEAIGRAAGNLRMQGNLFQIGAATVNLMHNSDSVARYPSLSISRGNTYASWDNGSFVFSKNTANGIANVAYNPESGWTFDGLDALTQGTIFDLDALEHTRSNRFGDVRYRHSIDESLIHYADRNIVFEIQSQGEWVPVTTLTHTPAEPEYPQPPYEQAGDSIVYAKPIGVRSANTRLYVHTLDTTGHTRTHVYNNEDYWATPKAHASTTWTDGTLTTDTSVLQYYGIMTPRGKIPEQINLATTAAQLCMDAVYGNDFKAPRLYK